MATKTVEYTFTVKEGHPSESGGEAPTSIMGEPSSEEFDFLGPDGFISIKLKEGTSIEKAQEIAKYLKQRVSGISVTTF